MTSDNSAACEDQSCVFLSRALHQEIRDFSALAWPEEACGLLVAPKNARNHITRVVFAQNIAPDPLTTFEIAPQTLFDAHRDARQKGETVVGCFHSHPNGKALPSPTDRARAEEAGFLWLVIATQHDGAGESKIYRIIHQAVDDGEPHAGIRYFRRCQVMED